VIGVRFERVTYGYGLNRSPLDGPAPGSRRNSGFEDGYRPICCRGRTVTSRRNCVVMYQMGYLWPLLPYSGKPVFEFRRFVPR
jgi:hypothetical protein